MCFSFHKSKGVISLQWDWCEFRRACPTVTCSSLFLVQCHTVWETRHPSRNTILLMALHRPTSFTFCSAVALPGWHLLALLSPFPSPAHLLLISPAIFLTSGQEWLCKHVFAQRVHKGLKSAELRNIQLSSTWLQSASAWGCYLQPLNEALLCRAKLSLEPTNLLNAFCTENSTMKPCHQCAEGFLAEINSEWASELGSMAGSAAP